MEKIVKSLNNLANEFGFFKVLRKIDFVLIFAYPICTIAAYSLSTDFHKILLPFFIIGMLLSIANRKFVLFSVGCFSVIIADIISYFVVMSNNISYFYLSGFSLLRDIIIYSILAYVGLKSAGFSVQFNSKNTTRSTPRPVRTAADTAAIPVQPNNAAPVFPDDYADTSYKKTAVPKYDTKYDTNVVSKPADSIKKHEPTPYDDMLVCPKCGTLNREDAKFCLGCGSPVKKI